MLLVFNGIAEFWQWRRVQAANHTVLGGSRRYFAVIQTKFLALIPGSRLLLVPMSACGMLRTRTRHFPVGSEMEEALMPAIPDPRARLSPAPLLKPLLHGWPGRWEDPGEPCPPSRGSPLPCCPMPSLGAIAPHPAPAGPSLLECSSPGVFLRSASGEAPSCRAA